MHFVSLWPQAAQTKFMNLELPLIEPKLDRIFALHFGHSLTSFSGMTHFQPSQYLIIWEAQQHHP
jgi:hypothetical protein